MTALSEIAPLSVHRLRGGGPRGEVLPSRIGEALHDGSRTAMRLGPAEWLVLDREPMDPVTGQPFDESDAWRLLRLQGKDAGDIVAQFCPIDAGAEGCAFATHLAGHPAILMPRSSGEFEILVPRSYAASLLALLRDAVTRSVSPERPG